MKTTFSKTLVLIRHAHRDTKIGREVDNGLSALGKKQAKRIASFFVHRFDITRPLLFSSPKIRCIETLVPLSKNAEVEISAFDLLDEQNESERSNQFARRVDEFKHFWGKSKAPLTIVCSHGDWIPLATRTLTGSYIDLKKGGWIEFEENAGELTLKWVIQSLETV